MDSNPTQEAAAEEEQAGPGLTPAVNQGAPLEDDSVRCRMSGVCEGLDACGRGKFESYKLQIFKCTYN